MPEKKLVVVTGSDRGLGECLVSSLVKKEEYKVIMTSLKLDEGKDARKKMGEKLTDEKLSVQELDLSNPKSVEMFVTRLKEKNMKIDILVNNAAVYSDKDEFSPEFYKKIFNTNFYGTIEFTERMLPLMNKDSKIIFIGDSRSKQIIKTIKSEDLKKRLYKENMSREDLMNLMKEYRECIEDNTCESKGWPRDIYLMSKIAIELYACVLGRHNDVMNRNIQVYSCSPGSIKTDMNKKGEKSVEEGIKTPLYLIELPSKIDKEKQGHFFENEKKVSIFEQVM